MRRVGLCLVLTALVGGCLHQTTVRTGGPPAKTAAVHEAPARPAAPPAATTPVTKEQVNAGNCREQCQALWDELDREEQTAGAAGATHTR